MSKTIFNIAVAVLSATLAAQAWAGGYRLDVAMPAAAEAYYRPGVERSARIAISQVLNDQFERFYPPDRWSISIDTTWSREEAGLRHASRCALEQRIPRAGSSQLKDPALWDVAYGLMNLGDENDHPIAALLESVMESCSKLARRAVRVNSVSVSPQIE